ncbi:MAG: AAA family ATPase [Candidatus Caldarchaeum sp.]
MDGQEFRDIRQRLRLRQRDMKDELNRMLGRNYDVPRISRWESGREPIPAEVGSALRRLAANLPSQTTVLCFANQKGGVGKTTSAINIAAALRLAGARVLLVDLDPQATATLGVVASRAATLYRDGKTMAHVILRDRPLEEIIIPADGPAEFACDVASSHIDLAEADSRREPGFEKALAEALDNIRHRYDVIVVDAPPNLGMLTWQALSAATGVIVPVRTEPYDAMGVGLILSTITKIQRRSNPHLRLLGVLPTQFNRRKQVDREVLAQIGEALGDRVALLEPVPEAALFGHASRNGTSALALDPDHPAVRIYRDIAAFLLGRAELPILAPTPPSPSAEPTS